MRFEETICFKCLGCNQLELKDFKGVTQCNNFVEIRKEKRDGKNI